jgi:hypothetical protein
MKKILMLLPLVAIATGAAALGAGSARPHNYAVMQESDCALVTPGELSQVINRAGAATGLDLPEGMALRAELHCAPDAGSKRFVYTVRATIDKQVTDGHEQRWASVAQLTGFGTTANRASLLREVQFTVRDVIRQEP